MGNVILASDSYKYTHASQYPIDTEHVYSYMESRGGRFPAVVSFGLQFLLKKYFSGKVVTQEKIDEAEEIINLHFGKKIFNRSNWEYILNEHDGRLPLSIKAVPEGTLVPTHNVLMTVCNTDPKCFWLTNFAETMLLHTW